MFEISKTPPNLSCDFSCDEDLSPEHTGGAFLPPVDSVPALSGFPPRGRALHKVKELRTAFRHPHPSTPHSRCVLFLSPLQSGLSHLLHEEEGPEGFGRPEQAGVSLWMVKGTNGHSFPPFLHLISDDLIQSVTFDACTNEYIKTLFSYYK